MHDPFDPLMPLFVRRSEIDLNDIHTNLAVPPDTPCIRPSRYLKVASLFEIYGGRGRPVGREDESALGARFYLADDERSATAGNDIDLLAVKEPISFQNAVKTAAKITGGRLFSEDAATSRFGLGLFHFSRNLRKLFL